MSARISRAGALATIGAVTVALKPGSLRAQSQPIRIGTLANGDTYALPFYAQDGGFFTKAGLNVEIVPIGEPSSIIASVAGGSIDAGFADPPLIGNANNRGLPVAYFAGGGLYSSDAPTTVLVVAPSASYRSPKDFHGETIAVVVAKSIGAAALTSWITQGGGDPTQIRLIEMPFTVMVTAVTKGEIAAAFLAEPYLTNAKNDVRIIAKPFDAIGPRFLINSCFASRSWITANAAVAGKLAAAIAEASRLDQRPSRRIGAIARTSGQSAAGRGSVDEPRPLRRTRPALDPAGTRHRVQVQIAANSRQRKRHHREGSGCITRGGGTDSPAVRKWPGPVRRGSGEMVDAAASKAAE